MIAKWASVIGLIVLSCLTIAGQAAEIKTSAIQAHITDFESGKVLFSKNADAPMKPASMAKIMTVFIAFQRIADGSLKMTDEMTVSKKAWRKGGSRSFVELGSKVSVYDLLHGIIIQSGNDAAIAIAEGISGTEEAFADEMNFWAKKIGMKNTNFRNATGWPDPDLTTSAADMSLLAAEMLRRFPADKYPDLYPIFGKRDFTYNKIKQPNRNPLIYGSVGADGLKTGHTEESGYGLVGSAIRDNRRVVLVLNGMNSIRERATESRRLMDLVFREFKPYLFFEAGQPVDTANVWLGAMPKVNLVLDAPLKMVLSHKERREIKMSLSWRDPIPAPIKAGDQLGKMTIELPFATHTLALRAGHDVPPLGLFNRFGAAINYLIFGAPVSPVAEQ